MIEIDGCCSAFVYRPDDVHPDGWTGTGDTLAIRYFELVGLPDGTSACRAYADWVGANGAEAEPGCYAPDRQQDMTAVVGPESVTIGDVIYRAQVRVDSSDIRVTFAAITDG